MQRLYINEEAAWRGARVELGRCLARIVKISFLERGGRRWESIENEAQLDEFFENKQQK